MGSNYKYVVCISYQHAKAKDRVDTDTGFLISRSDNVKYGFVVKSNCI